jgi:hypothetical protein
MVEVHEVACGPGAEVQVSDQLTQAQDNPREWWKEESSGQGNQTANAGESSMGPQASNAR